MVANPLGYDHYNALEPIRRAPIRQSTIAPIAAYLPPNHRRPSVESSRTEPPPVTTVFVTPKTAYTANSLRAGPDVRRPATGLQTPFGPISANPDAFHTPIAVYASTPAPIAKYDSQHFNGHEHQHRVRAGAVEQTANNQIRSSTSGDVVRPIFDRSTLRHRADATPLVASNTLGNGYDPQYAPYDGVSQTANGFQYYLPRHYHEEESDAAGKRRAGSFGYVDPFGIRRVVYYRATPEGGFQHRKNNRYVGFGATPYDPQPL